MHLKTTPGEALRAQFTLLVEAYKAGPQDATQALLQVSVGRAVQFALSLGHSELAGHLLSSGKWDAGYPVGMQGPV